MSENYFQYRSEYFRRQATVTRRLVRGICMEKMHRETFHPLLYRFAKKQRRSFFAFPFVPAGMFFLAFSVVCWWYSSVVILPVVFSLRQSFPRLSLPDADVSLFYSRLAHYFSVLVRRVTLKRRHVLRKGKAEILTPSAPRNTTENNAGRRGRRKNIGINTKKRTYRANKKNKTKRQWQSAGDTKKINSYGRTMEKRKSAVATSEVRRRMRANAKKNGKKSHWFHYKET